MVAEWAEVWGLSGWREPAGGQVVGAWAPGAEPERARARLTQSTGATCWQWALAVFGQGSSRPWTSRWAGPGSDGYRGKEGCAGLGSQGQPCWDWLEEERVWGSMWGCGCELRTSRGTAREHGQVGTCSGLGVCPEGPGRPWEGGGREMRRPKNVGSHVSQAGSRSQRDRDGSPPSFGTLLRHGQGRYNLPRPGPGWPSRGQSTAPPCPALA